MSNMRDQVIALTGLWQALELVHQFAKQGELDAPQRRRFDAALSSLFIRADEKDNAQKVFGGIQNLEFGFHGLALQLEQHSKRNQVVVYMAQVMLLQRRLSQNAAMTGKIANRIAGLDHQHSYFTEDKSQLLANLGELYSETLGSLPMNKRIRVYGKGDHLKVEIVQHSIRALLLAALRAAMLWQQMGGNRFTLLFQRKRILRELYLLCR